MSPLRRYGPLIALVAVFIAINAIGASLGPGRGYDIMWDRSSYRTNPAGYGALFRVAERLGYDVTRLEDPFADLSPFAELWLVNPTQPVKPDELIALRRYVSDGGTLVGLFGETAARSCVVPWGTAANETFPELDEVGYSGTELPRLPALLNEGVEPPSPTHIACAPRSYGADVKSLTVASEVRMTGRVAEKGALVSDRLGVLVTELRIGKGRVVLCADPDLFANDTLGQEDNALLAVNLMQAAGGGLIAFDEYHHGFRRMATAGDVLHAYAGKGGVYQIAAVCLLAMIAAGWRFGMARRLRPVSRRSVLEYVDSMALLYRRADARAVAAEALNRGARRRIAAKLGLAPNATNAEMADRMRLLRMGEPVVLRAALERAARAAQRCETDGELVAATQALDDQLRGLSGNRPAP
jgi:hypothetical protein